MTYGTGSGTAEREAGIAPETALPAHGERALHTDGIRRPRFAGERPRVLVIEDDEHDREIYGRMLCYNGFDVLFAANGAAADRLLNRYGIDAILLDLGLPDVSGLTLLEKLRKRDRSLAQTPVIVLSAYSRRRMGELARKAGCTEYVEKPASPVAVLHAVERLVGRAPLPGEGRPPAVLASE